MAECYTNVMCLSEVFWQWVYAMHFLVNYSQVTKGTCMIYIYFLQSCMHTSNACSVLDTVLTSGMRLHSTCREPVRLGYVLIGG